MSGNPQNLEGYTHEQIIALTEDDIERMIQLACAEDGIPLLKRPDPIEEFKPFETDRVCFQIGDVVTTDEEFANQLATLLSDHSSGIFRLDYDYKIGSDYHTLKESYHSDKGSTIKRTPYFSQEAFDKIKDELLRRTKLKKEYEAKKDAYDKAYRKRQGWEGDIQGTWYEHLRLEENIKRHIEEFRNYLELANKDVAMAYSFFCKAFRNLNQMAYDRVIKEFNIPIGDAESIKNLAETTMTEKDEKAKADKD